MSNNMPVYSSSTEFVILLKCRQCGITMGRTMFKNKESIPDNIRSYMDTVFFRACGKNVFGVCEIIGGAPKLETR